MECFEDFTIQKHENKSYAMIAKREFNPELSALSNLVLDLVDFKDRVRPLANDLTLMDVTSKHQRTSMQELDSIRAEMLAELDLGQRYGGADLGYSSGEISEKSTINDEPAAQ